MRFDIHGQFVVGVVRTGGGISKGRRIAFIEEPGACRPVDLLIPDDLDDQALETYIANKFSAFARRDGVCGGSSPSTREEVR
jgi:hypothetical protein